MMRNCLELVELEVRELLNEYEFPGDEYPSGFWLCSKAVEALTANPSLNRG